MNIAHYLLQVNLYLVAFYLLYSLLLSKETYFTLNRIYLVSAGVLSLVIPFIRLAFFAKQEIHQQFYLSIDQLLSQGVVTEVEKSFNWGLLLVAIYIFGVLFCALILIFKVIHLRKIFKTVANGQAFSFLNKKIVSDNLPERETINEHENLHVKQLHTLDVLLFELLGIINWFNPFSYWYKNAIKNIHEYLADEEAANLASDKKAYALLLLSHALNVSPNTLTNSFFNKSMLKKRIYMLHKQRSKKVAFLKYGLFVPLFLLALILSSSSIDRNEKILAFSKQIPLQNFDDIKNAITAPIAVVQSINQPENNEPNNQKNMKNSLRVAVLALATLTAQQSFAQKTDSLKANVMDMKVIKNGDTTTLKKLGANPLYVINGEVAEKDAINKISPSDIATIEVLKDQSAIALYGDKGKNGVVIITKKSGTYVKKKEFGEEMRKGNLTITEKDLPVGANPLILVDGKSISKTEMDRLDPNTINKIDVLKENAAISVYGDKGKDGVILITTEPKNITYRIHVQEKEQIFDFVSIERQPEFPGGIAAFYKYVGENLKYPETALKDKIQGRVFLSFIVEKDGMLTDIKVTKGLSAQCDQEAVRVISNSKKWNPGMLGGKPVKVLYNIAINFNLNK